MDGAVADTHSVIWYLDEDARLSSKAAECFELCRMARRRVLVPSICIVEIVYLIEKGRLSTAPLDRLLEGLGAADTVLRLAPLDALVALAMKEVPRSSVPDMPDRIIAATALQAKLPLISRDRKIRSSGIETIW